MPDERNSATVTHIAANEVTIGANRLRQRCAWCGAVLLDYDLERVGVAVEPGEVAESPAVWPMGRLVRVFGGQSYVLPDANELPDDACASLDDEVTR